jgi:Tfp pilus assembly protein PilX
MEKQTTYRESERGIALIVALLAILVLSVLAVAVMSTSQSQAWTSLNYRMAAQARYAAEAGVQTTMNWLSSSNYTTPTFASYTMTTNPVQYSGKAVVLSPVSGASNYPDSTVVTNFGKVAAGTVPGVSNASYSTTATLLRMTSGGGVSWLPGTGGGAMQTWQITSTGTIGGVLNATVQVTQTFERTGSPVFQYGLEALGTGCGAITLAGSDYTDSYNSAAGTYASQTPGSAGSIATNGNVNLASSAKVNGNIGAPNTKVGACPDGLTDSGSKNYGSLTAVSSMSAPLPFGCTKQPCYPTSPAVITTAQNISTGCSGITGCTKNASTDTIYDGGTKTTVNDFTLTPGSYGNITINGADVVHMTAGTYTVNSLNFAADGQIVVDSGPVVLQLAGNCSSGCPSESVPKSAMGQSGSGNVTATEVIYGAGYAGVNACAPSGGKGVIANPNVYGSETCGSSKTTFSGIPSNMQIVYGGTNLIRLGGMPNAAVIYDPAGHYYTPGAPVGLYGSVITSTFDDASGSPWHYDTSELNSVVQVGNFRPDRGFSWSKF